MIVDKNTILKYDVAGPRYTSYPTAPVWSEKVNQSVYIEKLKAFGKTDKTLSLYIHIPFCQSMCTYCACNVIIRKQDEKYGDEYLEYLSKEIDLIRKYMGKKPRVKQFHWGGGTPTFLNVAQIERLFQKVADNFDLDFDGEIAIEIDPRTIDKLKVKKLHDLGFNRISMGVQDFNADVQKEINREQPFAIVKEFNDWCRKLKFHSVNFDLIYGLPRQTPQSFEETLEQVIKLKPDRIALYSFAYVPWLKKHQHKINPQDLPSNDQKLEIFLMAREKFLQAGYEAIAMDHFALADDELARAFKAGRLYRNFMGYTVKPADEYIGLGLTSIGFLEKTFIQNHKILRDYFAALDRGELPVERGLALTRDDQIRQWTISSLMCHFEIDKSKFHELFKEDFDVYFKEEKSHMEDCLENGLLTIKNGILKATDLGKIFVRNICMGFDKYLPKESANRRFSRTI